MTKAILAACAVIFISLPAPGQETPKGEVFGGYSYFRGDGGSHLHGWNASITANLNRWFGVTADFSGHYNSERSSLTVLIPRSEDFASRVDATTNIHNFLLGGTFSYRGHESLIPFARVLAGFSRNRENVEYALATRNGIVASSYSNSDTAFAAAVGGGLDVKLSKSFALRVIQVDYLLTRFEHQTQNNVRISTGIVFRFGDK